MGKRAADFLRPAARALAILFIAFVSLFALDACSSDKGVGWNALALLIHLTPSFLLAAALLVAWRWEPAGAVCFLAIGAGFLASFHFRTPAGFLLIGGPVFLIAILFAADWALRRPWASGRRPR